MALLHVAGLRKSYGKFQALAGVDFAVEAGELFGLLGPNGAGKTTLISILACLSNADAGTATLGGIPLNKNARELKPRIGIVTQDLAIYPELTARENLHFFGRLYGLSQPLLQERSDEILNRIGLTDRAGQRASQFSGGMKRRLNLGVAIMHQPEILFLDEPTTGVDPQSRNHIFEHVRELNRQGLTVIYTSHYMEEVQALCPRLAIIDQGRVIACSTVQDLLKQHAGTVRLDAVDGTPPAALEILLNALQATGKMERVQLYLAERKLELHCKDTGKMLLLACEICRTHQIELEDVQAREPMLEDVFLRLTDRTLRD